MSLVFSAVLIISCVCLLIYNPEAILKALLDGGSAGLSFTFKLFAVYAVWLSVLQIWSKLKFDSWLGEGLKPVLKKIFPKENEACYGFLAVNLSANMLGMGNAGTPAGIKAIEAMSQKKNKIMLLVINSTSVQLIPTTIIAMRSTYGSTSDIILPSLIATVAGTALGFVLVKIFVK